MYDVIPQYIYILLKNTVILMCYFLLKAHSTEKTPVTRVFPTGTHFTAESTEAMLIKCLGQGYN